MTPPPDKLPAPLRVAVITPYFGESIEILENCHRSVLNQSYPCIHFLISDGSPRAAEVQKWRAEHITLPRPHGDVGNTPRCVGSLVARNLDFDAIAYLDADNWYYPDHIESMVRLHRETGAAVCSATRNIHRLDGTMMYTDTFDSDGKQHVDTSCYFFARRAYGLLPLWGMMPHELGPIGDTMMWNVVLAQGLARAHHPPPTVAFRTQYKVHYARLGEQPPPDAKGPESTEAAVKWWDALDPAQQQAWRRYFAASALL